MEALNRRFEASTSYLKNLIESELSGYKQGEWVSIVRLKVEDDPDL